MLDTLAKKYGIDQTKEAWLSALFNKLCLAMESIAALTADLANCRKELAETKTQLAEKIKAENFIIKTLADKKVAPLFKAKIRKMLKANGIKIETPESGPLLARKKFTVH